MTFVKGVSGNPTGRPRRDPLSDPAVLEAIERCLHWPLTRQPKTRAELLAMRVIKKATSTGTLKPLYVAQERLLEHRRLKANRVTRPWDYGDDVVTGEEQSLAPQIPLSAPIEQKPFPEPTPTQQAGQAVEQAALARLAAIQAKAAPVPRFSVFGQPRRREATPADERFDYSKGLDNQELWAIAHEPGFLSRPLPEPEPVRPTPRSLPYRIGSPAGERL